MDACIWVPFQIEQARDPRSSRDAFAPIDVVARIGHAKRRSSATGHIEGVPCVTMSCDPTDRLGMLTQLGILPDIG